MGSDTDVKDEGPGRSAWGKPGKQKGMLAALERVGNALPNPFWLFVIFAGIVIVAVDNFVSFAPLGLILVCMLGVAIAEYSGFIGAAIRGAVSKVKSPLANYFFSMSFSVVLAAIITAVTELFVVKYTRKTIPDELVNHEAAVFTVPEKSGDHDEVDAAPSGKDGKPHSDDSELKLADEEKRALKVAGLTALVFMIAWFVLLLVPGSPMRGEGDGILNSPLLENIVVSIAAVFAAIGIAYGLSYGSIRNSSDVPKFMEKGLGARVDLPPLALFAAFVLMVALINLVITSGSAQWALMAPIVVPMLMYVGISPEVTQMLYRIGDSPTNIITPMSPYFALALTFLQKYYKGAGVGTLMALAIPYSIAMMLGWFLFFVLWYLAGIPLGPGAPVR